MQAGEKNTRGSNDAPRPGAAGERVAPPLASSGVGGVGGDERGRGSTRSPIFRDTKNNHNRSVTYLKLCVFLSRCCCRCGGLVLVFQRVDICRFFFLWLCTEYLYTYRITRFVIVLVQYITRRVHGQRPQVSTAHLASLSSGCAIE